MQMRWKISKENICVSGPFNSPLEFFVLASAAFVVHRRDILSVPPLSRAASPAVLLLKRLDCHNRYSMPCGIQIVVQYGIASLIQPRSFLFARRTRSPPWTTWSMHVSIVARIPMMQT